MQSNDKELSKKLFALGSQVVAKKYLEGLRHAGLKEKRIFCSQCNIFNLIVNGVDWRKNKGLGSLENPMIKRKLLDDSYRGATLQTLSQYTVYSQWIKDMTDYVRKLFENNDGLIVK